MRGPRETVAKALALECMRAARAQERGCFVFAFSGPQEVDHSHPGMDLRYHLEAIAMTNSPLCPSAQLLWGWNFGTCLRGIAAQYLHCSNAKVSQHVSCSTGLSRLHMLYLYAQFVAALVLAGM